MTRRVPLPLPLSMRHGAGRVDLGAHDAVGVSAPPEIVALMNALGGRTRGIRFVAADPMDAAVVLSIADADPHDPELAALPRPRGIAPRAELADERYLLATRDGRVQVRAAHRAGLVRAVTTLLQLVTVGERVELDEVGIADAPRFAWRGLSLDVARRFFTIDELESVVDLLAWHRMNVLHLHLSDSQAWRLASERHPALASGGPAYSGAQLRALDAYAAERGVSLIPELDVPGHTHAAIAAYPHLVGETEFPHPAIAYLDPDHAPAVEFARTVFSELAGLVSSPYLHIGGDEAFGMPADKYARFVRLMIDHVHDLGRRAVGWQEATRADGHPPVDIAQFWITEHDAFDADAMKAKTDAVHHPLIDLVAHTFAQAPEDIGRAVAADVPVVISPSFPLYLDRRYAESDAVSDAEAADAVQAERAARLGSPDYAPEPMSTLAAWSPDAHAAALPAGAQVAGVEAALWCETVSSFDDAAFLLLPRLAIAAERAWNPVQEAWDATIERLNAHGPVWDALGFTARLRPVAQGRRVAQSGHGGGRP